MTQGAQWTTVDEGWGRAAAEFAALSEPGNVREYVAMHQRLGVAAPGRLLDVACGSGLAVELATARGATCSGIDASSRLIDVARDRAPDADLRVGDMHALPWADGSFDVVTSFRGIWGTTPDVLDEIRRVLRPGGRFGMTVWGHIKASPGAWALRPFTLATTAQVEHQAAMVRLGRPGVGEELLAQHGFADVTRVDVPFVWEFADPEHYARAIASTGPAYEAIQSVGEQQFLDHARELATARVRAGLPLRARIAVVGYLATRPAEVGDAPDEPSGSFLAVTPASAGATRLRQEDLADLGYVMNVSRLWGRMADTNDGLFALMRDAVDAGSLTPRQRGILTTATASTMGDSYCSLAWGGKLAVAADDADLAAGVLTGADASLTDAERALASWARKVVSAPNDTTPADVDELRRAGFDDQQVFAITCYVALRLAFSTVNDALGATPDAELVASLPTAVRDAVTWGRPAIVN